MRTRHLYAAVAVAALLGTGVVAGATASQQAVHIAPSGSDAALSCPGGMVRLSHEFDENASIFPGDPSPEIEVLFTAEDDGFLLESVKTGTHTGTHLSAPGHFIAGATTVDDLPASDFAWPAYVVDVTERVATNPDFQLSVADIRALERTQGTIPAGALVILRTGFDARFGTPAYLDTAPGFSGAAVSWMFKQRDIKGVASDTFGPDATSDENFMASYRAYQAGGITIENMAGVGQLHRTGDVVIASTVRLADGSGYQTDPLGCLRSTAS
ncbi:MAG: cyclase family protein [Acidimicrobiia bacterium]|nr:cyclase family protein [Acidimicrobiia bacterium]